MTDLGNSPASRDIAYVMHPYTNLKKHKETGPLIIERGQGVHVYDDSGKEYIEALAGLWCTSLGFNEERLVNAATEQLRKLPYYHIFAHKSTMPVIDLAERLINMAPVPMSKVFFANSGSEANDTVVKLVWYYHNAIGKPEKKKILARIKGYHGVTVAAASMTGLPANHADFDLPIANIMHVDCPHHWMFAEDGESEVDFATRLAANLEKRILEEGPETVAAFIAEPIMGAGGVILPPETYFEKVQAVLKKYDVLMIADEVICGFGRTGNPWGSQTFNIQPDILSCAKALSSAYLPISAVMVNDKVADVVSDNSGKIGTFGHGYTYTGHPVSVAVALETLKIYEERKIFDHVKAIAPRLQDGLRKYAGHPLVGEVRGTGLIAAVHLAKDKEKREMFDPALAVAPYVYGRMQEHGVITRAIGTDAIAFSPPLIITEAQLDKIVDAVGKGLDETYAWLKSEGHM